MKIIYFNNSSFGGLADYAHFQANALANSGVEVDFLCPPDFNSRNIFNYNRLALLTQKSKSRTGTKLSRALRLIKNTYRDIQQLNRHIIMTDAKYVLFGAYFEYFSPFWTPCLKRHNKNGTIFATVLHDPIRDSVVGPNWWHKKSIKEAYEFINIVFVHQHLDQAKFSIPSHCSVEVIPHGPYPSPSPENKMTKEEAKKALNLDHSTVTLLAFGNIRDNKNLDLAIKCLPYHPNIGLLIAGQSGSTSQKQPLFYKDLAESLGVSGRIKWFIKFIPDEEVAVLFTACEGVLLNYSSDFRSASGVLNLATSFNKRCIASSGISPLENTVKKYQLGEWAEPDNLPALSSAIGRFVSSNSNPKWIEYFKENTWDNNASIVIESLLNLKT